MKKQNNLEILEKENEKLKEQLKNLKHDFDISEYNRGTYMFKQQRAREELSELRQKIKEVLFDLLRTII